MQMSEIVLEHQMLFVTSLVAAALTIIFIRLSLAVIKLRRKYKVGLGSGGHDELERAIRAQGNFAEYVPFGIILLACLELNGAPWWLVALAGVILIVGRLIHAQGINTPPPNFSKRILGMKLTINTLIALIVLNVGWTVWRLIG
jgi:uncharacterized protein